MAELEFYWGVMKSGKSTLLLQTVYDYRQCGKHVLVGKPKIDTRGGTKITSRLGNGAIDIDVDFLIEGVGLFDFFKQKHAIKHIDTIFIDEAQFLTKEQVFELMEVVAILGIPIKTYGLRTRYDGLPFEGSSMLLANATKLIELSSSALCRFDKDRSGITRATANLRVVDGVPVFGGNESESIVIDGDDDVEYYPVSLRTWVALRNLSKTN